MRSKLICDYLLPTRIIACAGEADGLSVLTNQEENQVYLGNQGYFSMKGRGHIVLDFGAELQGGIRLLTARFPDSYGGDIRIRFGESVGEANSELGEKNSTNHHSLRDFSTYLPHLADQSFGQTGFRFVRIDFLEDKEYRLINIYACFLHRDMPAIGSFVSSDELLNHIFATAERTLMLNCQENLFEGIKRDRLVWVGDMQPEVLAFTYLYQDYDIIETALLDSVAKNPLPCWFGNIPTYSFWLPVILRDYYSATRKRELVETLWPYLQGVLAQLDPCIDENGEIDYSKSKASAREGFFLDWPSNGSPDAPAGNRYVFLLGLAAYLELATSLNLPLSPFYEGLDARLRKKKEHPTLKQVVALGFLAGEIEKEEAKEKLFQGGAKGLCTFLSYFIFKAMARTGTMEETLAVLKEYYGGMLSRGATSFWEDFNVEWLEGSGRIDEITPKGKKDLHGDYGAFCYKGFRHSLCHGWSVGPISFLIEEVSGYQNKDGNVSFHPNLGGLAFVSATVPTADGPVSADIKKEGPETKVEVYGSKG